MKKILIAIDNGPTSEKVASISFELGQKLNAEMALLSIVDTGLLMTDGAVTPEEMKEIMKDDYRKAQQLVIEKVFKDHKVRTFLEDGNPSEIILKTAEEWDADLIALGTHGRL
ncbi:MAG: universal stress protein, partial [Bacteroidia bacterium]